MQEYLKTNHPNPLLFAVLEQKLKIWRNATMKSNKFKDKHCRQTVQVLENYFYYRPGFPYFSSVNEVIKKNKERVFYFIFSK